MKKIKKSVIPALALCAVMTLSLASCTEAPSQQTFWDEGKESENEKFTALTSEFFRDSLKNDMLNLHFTVMEPENYGIERPAMDLFAESDVDYEEFLSFLERIDYHSLSRRNRITYDILKEDLSDAIEWASLNDIGSSFSYSSGVQSNLITYAVEYEFFIEQDVVDYLDMMNQVGEYFEYLYEGEEERAENGFGFSDEVLSDVIEQFDVIYGDGEDTCLISSFDERVSSLDFLTESEKQEYMSENREAVLNVVLPAYEDTAEKLSSLMGKGTNAGGICGYDGGEEYYEMLVKSYANFNGTAEELYAKLSDFYDEQYDRLVRLVQGSEKNYNMYYQWATGDVKSLTDPVESLEFFSSHLDGYFPVIENTTYTVKYLSESVANTMPNTLAYYLIPQIDHYTNGSITINGYASDDAGLMNTIAHEGYPGHLYQNVYFLSTNPDPVRSLFSFSGYAEGWAVYAANQAEYIYEYPASCSIYPQLNEINTSLSYAIYAMMDIGVNYEGWGIPYITGMLGCDEETAQILYTTLVEMPGVYLSYGAGNMLMYELRDKAQALAGSNFDLVEYHRLILDIGPCNFGLLEDLIEEYYRIAYTEDAQLE